MSVLRFATRAEAEAVADPKSVSWVSGSLPWEVRTGADIPPVAPAQSGGGGAVTTGNMKFLSAWVTGGGDQTSAVQAALDALAAGDILIYDVPVVHGNVRVQNKTRVKIWGSSVTLTGAGVNGLGYEFYGTCDDVELSGFTITGDGTTTGNHKGFWSNSGNTLTNIKIHHNTIQNCINGISCNANLSGVCRDWDIYENKVYDAVGINSGYGYGIHAAVNTLVSDANITIRDNTIRRAKRHSIYVARGNGFVVSGNKIYDHRSTLTADEIADASEGRGKIRPAIYCARTSHVKITGNFIYKPYDTGLQINNNPGNPSDVNTNILVSDNTLMFSRNGVPLMAMGSAYPDADGVQTDVHFISNKLYVDGQSGAALAVYSAKSSSVVGTEIFFKNAAAAVNCIDIYGIMETAGTALYTDDLLIADNNAYGTLNGGSIGEVMLRSEACAAASRIKVRRGLSSGVVTSGVSYQSTLTNPNVSVT